MVASDLTCGLLVRRKKVMSERKAEDWISEWEGMQEEFIEEGTMFRVTIPSIEKTQEWMDGEKPLLKVVGHDWYKKEENV